MYRSQRLVCDSILFIACLANTAQAAKFGADFNGDGFDDIVVGIPYKTVSGQAYAGAVSVFYGSANGIRAEGDQVWHQDKPGIANAPEVEDFFGWAMANGDFNHDGFDDLAIGAPYESIGGVAYAGVVHVIYGSSHGLDADGDQLWYSDKDGVPGDASIQEAFGYALISADFDKDGFDDLAIGAPYQTAGAVANAGAVTVLYGHSSGLRTQGSELWHQDVTDIAGMAETGDFFGASLTAGDFNDDGFPDLAVGAPYEAVGAVEGAGAVNIILGGPNGLKSQGNVILFQGLDGTSDTPEESDNFGMSLAAADFDHNGAADLAVGVPNESVDGVEDAGAVHVFYGSSTGLSGYNSEMWTQNTPSMDDECEDGEIFGYALAAADFDNDGFKDLAIGIPVESIGTIYGGAVQVLRGSIDGLTTDGSKLLSQESEDMVDNAQNSEYFGYALSVGDFNHDGKKDLVVGVPGEMVGTKSYVGAIEVIYGSQNGLRGKKSQLWHQDKSGIGGTAAAYDYFGIALMH